MQDSAGLPACSKLRCLQTPLCCPLSANILLNTSSTAPAQYLKAETWLTVLLLVHAAVPFAVPVFHLPEDPGCCDTGAHSCCCLLHAVVSGGGWLLASTGCVSTTR
jgi:hypothetical protein